MAVVCMAVELVNTGLGAKGMEVGKEFIRYKAIQKLERQYI